MLAAAASERRGLVDEASARSAWERKEEARAGWATALTAVLAARQPIIIVGNYYVEEAIGGGNKDMPTKLPVVLLIGLLFILAAGCCARGPFGLLVVSYVLRSTYYWGPQ